MVVSVVVHLSLVAPSLASLLLFPEKPDPNEPVAVDYLYFKEPKEPDANKIEASIRPIESPKIELTNKVELKKETPKVPVPAPKDALSKMPIREIARKQAKIRSTKDYISYYQLIREGIREKLKDNYKSYYKEGDVALLFLVKSDGSLGSIEIERGISTQDDALLEIALRSVREAAPFAAFPKALKEPVMSFSLTISFKRE